MKVLLLVILVMASACSTQRPMTHKNVEKRIKCFSGNNLIYEGVAVGKIDTNKQFMFTDVSGQEVVVNGTCLITAQEMFW